MAAIILELEDHQRALGLKKSKRLLQELQQKESIEMFTNWTEEDYRNSTLKEVNPMLVRNLPDELVGEYLSEEYILGAYDQPTKPAWVLQHKLDGERQTLHIKKHANRLFSRRYSKKTNWLAENSDRLQHLRDFRFPEKYWGTVLDGELLHPSGEFKKVGSVLRSLPDRAWQLQKDEGFLFYVVYDVVYWKGKSVRHLPYRKRLKLLQKIAFEGGNFRTAFIIPIQTVYKGVSVGKEGWKTRSEFLKFLFANKKEGMILKDLNGTYLNGLNENGKEQRSKEVLRIKEYRTWDVVITGYDTSLAEYKGKEIENLSGFWSYWFDPAKNETIKNTCHDTETMLSCKCVPITRYCYNDWVNAVKWGVCVHKDEIKKLPAELQKAPMHGYDLNKKLVLVELGQTSGMDDAIREDISKNKANYIGKVFEVGANGFTTQEIGALRHPRFLRWRDDKNAEECTFSSHIMD